MDREAPSADVARRSATNLRVLTAARPEDRLEPAHKAWESHFAWSLLITLLVALPFLAVAGFFDLAKSGPWLPIGLMLAATIALAPAAWWTARPIAALSRVADRVDSGDLSTHATPGGSQETRRLATTFNHLMERLVVELPRIRDASPGAFKLARSVEKRNVTTGQQTKAAAQSTAELEALVKGSAALAATIAGVVAQAGELRTNIQRAQTDLQGSTDRTQANARRVNEIQAVLALLNDIADQTALLALNAAIEAARAGEAGRGFAVVADEVRRLAERSKAAAAEITTLAQGAQATSGEAVTAIARRGQQLDRWMSLTQAMFEISCKVEPAVQQHHALAENVELAVQVTADRSRAVAAAADELMAAAAAQFAPAGDDPDRPWGPEVGA